MVWTLSLSSNCLWKFGEMSSTFEITTEYNANSSTLSKLTSEQPHLLPPYARSRDRFGLSWETLILSDASGLSSVQRGRLLVGYLHKPCWRYGAAEGPVVGVVFKGKRRKTQRIYVALEHCLWKTGTLLGKKRLDLKCAYKSSHGSGELHKCAEWEAEGVNKMKQALKISFNVIFSA